jgi:hypothetical protein
MRGGVSSSPAPPELPREEDVSIKDRIRRLEDRGGCPECATKPELAHVVYPEEGDHTPEPERCPECDRSLGFVIRVEYEGEGEVLPIEQM